nr:reverse transcriptase domain-containing protein [Tanacetum cinerariifolium]
MSSPNHSTSNIEDAFSLNFLKYLSASSDFVPASSGKTYSSSSNSFGIVSIASPSLLLFHDDPYIKVMHAYYAKKSHIPPLIITPPSSMPNPQEFFLPEELLSPKIQGHDQSSSSTSTLPQAFEIGKSSPPAMTQAAIKKFVADSVIAALEAQAATMANTIGLIRWFERIKLVFSHSRCAEENKVTFATGTLTDDALSWWNAYAQPIGVDQANKITWTELKRLLTNKYYPRTEVRKMEEELYNLIVKGNDLKTYVRRFQESAVLCPYMVPNTEKLLEAFIEDEKRIKDIPVVREFPAVFPEDLPGLLPIRQVEFQIDLIPRAAPIARTPYRLAPSEM